MALLGDRARIPTMLQSRKLDSLTPFSTNVLGTLFVHLIYSFVGCAVDGNVTLVASCSFVWALANVSYLPDH